MAKRNLLPSKVKIQDLTHDTVPASVGLLKEVRDELRADIRAVEHGLNSQIKQVDSKIKQVDSRVSLLDSKVEQLSSKVENVMVSVYRTQVLMEEQRGENRIVLDGIKTLIERQNRIETDVGELSRTVRTLKARA